MSRCLIQLTFVTFDFDLAAVDVPAMPSREDFGHLVRRVNRASEETARLHRVVNWLLAALGCRTVQEVDRDVQFAVQHPATQPLLWLRAASQTVVLPPFVTMGAQPPAFQMGEAPENEVVQGHRLPSDIHLRVGGERRPAELGRPRPAGPEVAAPRPTRSTSGSTAGSPTDTAGANSEASHDGTRHDSTSHDGTRHGSTSHDSTSHGSSSHGSTSHASQGSTGQAEGASEGERRRRPKGQNYIIAQNSTLILLAVDCHSCFLNFASNLILVRQREVLWLRHVRRR